MLCQMIMGDLTERTMLSFLPSAGIIRRARPSAVRLYWMPKIGRRIFPRALLLP